MRTLQKKLVLNTLFHIAGTAADKGTILLCEWGETHCCIARYNEGTKTLSSLRYFTFQKNNEAATQEIISFLKDESNDEEKIVICSAFLQAVLTPSKIYNKEANLVQTMYGGSGNEYADTINEWSVVNAFIFSAEALIKQQFPAAFFLHVYTPELKIYNGFVAENQIAVNFTPNYFRVLVKRSGQLELAQIYFYNAPLDVVYYLLKIVEELHFDKEDTLLILSGLIEESSALYKELDAYFTNVHFAKASGVTLPGNEHPQHFFTTMYNLAACVS